MTKTIYLFSLLSCWLATVYAQDDYLHALNTNGNTGTSDGKTFNYSVGETVVFPYLLGGVVRLKCDCKVSSIIEPFDGLGIIEYNHL